MMVRTTSTARLGTFDELMDGVDTALAAVARALRELIFDLQPDASEVVRLNDRAATDGLGPRTMQEGYCSLMPQRAWVNLGFYQGARLDDPEALLEGSGVLLRHVTIGAAEMADRPALRALIVAAIGERRAALGRR
jgi:hypothetical protein